MKPGTSGPRHHRLPRVPGIMEIVWSWLGAFTGIGLIALLAQWWSKPAALMLIGSYGASAVLVYGAPRSPFAQPRNLLGGHVLSALTGVAFFQLFPDSQPLAAALAVATAIALMQVTRTLHPPGGATALIAVLGPQAVHDAGWLFPLPVALGAAILLAVALAINNLPGQRRYPEYWFRDPQTP